MNKCFKCGNEFAGNFCPQCGAKRSEKATCPKCGSEIGDGALFCGNCGYDLSSEGKVEPVPTDKPEAPVHSEATAKKSSVQPHIVETKTNMLQGSGTIAAKCVRFAPLVLYGLFSVLAFLFMLGDVWEVDSFFYAGNAINVYQFTKLEEIPLLYYPCIGYIAFSAISVFGTIVNVVCLFVSPQRYYDRENSNNGAHITFYLFFIALSIVIIVGLHQYDEGTGILEPGPAPILFIVFSAVFAALTIACLLVRKYVFKDTPKTKQQKTGGLTKETNKKGEIIIAVITFVIVCALPVLLRLTIFSRTDYTSSTSNKFSVSKMESISLGYSRENIRNNLGEPDMTSNGNSVWEYYDTKLLNYKEQIEEKTKEQEKALMEGDINKFDKIAEEINAISEKAQSGKYKYIRIIFRDGDTLSVYYNTQYSFNSTSGKQLKECKILNGVTGFYCEDMVTGENIFLTGKVYNNASYAAYFSDGSYYKGYIDNYTIDKNAVGVTLKWSDELYSYSQTFGCDQRAVTITSDGVWEGVGDYGTDLESIELPESVTSIGDYGFYGWSKLQSITIGNNVKSIGKSAFYECGNLTSVTIGDGVTSIGEQAFSGCKKLQSITIGAGVTSIGNDAFVNCAELTEVHINDIAAWCNIDFYIDKNDNYAYSNPLYKGAKLYLQGRLVEDLIIPANVVEIKNYAFYNYDSLKSVTIAKNTTSIGNQAFYDCDKLTNVTIGENVTSIGAYAFGGCDNLVSAEFEDPTGWEVSQNENFESGKKSVELSESDNAYYLRSRYYDYYWRKSN